MQRICLPVIFTVIVLTGGAVSAEADGPPPYVSVDTVIEKEEVITKRYTGHVTTKSSVNLLVRVSGELLRTGFEEGDMVREGQVLYELDDVRYVAEVKNAQARVAECEARLIYANLSLNRAEGLYDHSAGTKEDADRAESEFLAARAALLAAEAQLITVEDDLKNTRISAPISGKIGQTNYTVGNYLTPSSGVIATINQFDPLRVTFTMANRDFLDMSGSEENMKANFSFRVQLANGSIYGQEGRFAFFDNQASRKTDAIRIFTEFDNPEETLVPGSTVTVLLSRMNGKKYPSVLPSAIMRDSQSPYVYVLDAENRVERRDVVLGTATRDGQIVRSGLRAGERIVVDGTHKVVPEAIVEPVVVAAVSTLSDPAVHIRHGGGE